jgi:hypothetical protein
MALQQIALIYRLASHHGVSVVITSVEMIQNCWHIML